MENFKKEPYQKPLLSKHESLRDITARGSFSCNEESPQTFNFWYQWQR